MICRTVAPNTLRTPISFFLFATVYSDNPNKPRLATMIASVVNHQSTVENNWSFLYWLLKRSSKKKNCKGLCGKCLLQTCFDFATTCCAFAVFSFKEKLTI